MHPTPHRATLADLLAVADEKPYYELLDGDLSQKAAPLFRHGRLQARIARLVSAHFGDDVDDSEPGGWWLATEVHVQLGPDIVVVPDVVGWRIDRLREPPEDFPVESRPDWICEILSESNRGRDTLRKFKLYHAAHVPHYWIADPENHQLSVFRWQPDRYFPLLNVQPPARVRPEPFDAIEYEVADLLGVR